MNRQIDSIFHTLLEASVAGRGASLSESAGVRSDLEGVERVGSYRLLRRLGAGAFGVVYAAIDERSGREVALKVLNGLAEAHRARFDREVAAHRRVCSSRVASLLDAGEATLPSGEARLYLAFELLPANLRHAMDAGAIDERAAVAIAHDVARGLAALHEAGLCHRDLKPENVLIGEDGAKVTDLGLIRELHLLDGSLADTNDRLTRQGAFVGTVAYAAPEQIAGEPASPASDAWALGVLFYELLAGHHPFARPNPFAMAAAITSARVDLSCIGEVASDGRRAVDPRAVASARGGGVFMRPVGPLAPAAAPRVERGRVERAAPAGKNMTAGAAATVTILGAVIAFVLGVSLTIANSESAAVKPKVEPKVERIHVEWPTTDQRRAKRAALQERIEELERESREPVHPFSPAPPVKERAAPSRGPSPSKPMEGRR